MHRAYRPGRADDGEPARGPGEARRQRPPVGGGRDERDRRAEDAGRGEPRPRPRRIAEPGRAGRDPGRGAGRRPRQRPHLRAVRGDERAGGVFGRAAPGSRDGVRRRGVAVVRPSDAGRDERGNDVHRRRGRRLRIRTGREGDVGGLRAGPRGRAGGPRRKTSPHPGAGADPEHDRAQPRVVRRARGGGGAGDTRRSRRRGPEARTARAGPADSPDRTDAARPRGRSDARRPLREPRPRRRRARRGARGVRTDGWGWTAAGHRGRPPAASAERHRRRRVVVLSQFGDPESGPLRDPAGGG